MSVFQKHLGWAVIMSELGHVFCCVIPTVVTVLSAFSNIGLFVMTPDGILMNIHDAMHEYEVPIIVFSGAMVALGWFVHMASQKVDCHDTGCGHPPCAPQKSRNSSILAIATLLFLVNVIIYFGIHRNVLDLPVFAASTEEHHDHEGAEGHNHDHHGHE